MVLPSLGVPTGTVGAISELMVSADLMMRGFHVYRALSPACPVDLIAWRGATFLRVEVKTATVLGDGSINHPAHTHDQHDLIALFRRDTREVVYRADGIDVDIESFVPAGGAKGGEAE